MQKLQIAKWYSSWDKEKNPQNKIPIPTVEAGMWAVFKLFLVSANALDLQTLNPKQD